MVLPIIASVVREVFAQSPAGEKEAALALGGTRWGMIRTVVLPYGKGGIIGGSMLGLGRALGETIAVALLLPQVPRSRAEILQNGGATVSGFIANRAGGDAFTDVRAHGRRARAVRHHARHQPDRVGGRRPQPLRAQGSRSDGAASSARPTVDRRPARRRGGAAAARVRGCDRSAPAPREFTSTDVVTLRRVRGQRALPELAHLHRLTGGVGWFGFLVCTYVGVPRALRPRDQRPARAPGRHRPRGHRGRHRRSRSCVVVPLVLLIGYIVVQGLKALRRGASSSRTRRGITPVLPGDRRRGAHAMVGTLEQVGLALLWSLPLGLAAAVFLNESRSRWRRPVRIFVDAMSGLPSIVAGLFIFAAAHHPVRQAAGRCSGSTASWPAWRCRITMLPDHHPDGRGRAAARARRPARGEPGLGASRARTVWSVVLPTARTGIDHRRGARHRPRRRRDGAAAVHRLRLRPA